MKKIAYTKADTDWRRTYPSLAYTAVAVNDRKADTDWRRTYPSLKPAPYGH